jgi:hypothetical protein
LDLKTETKVPGLKVLGWPAKPERKGELPRVTKLPLEPGVISLRYSSCEHLLY